MQTTQITQILACFVLLSAIIGIAGYHGYDYWKMTQIKASNDPILYEVKGCLGEVYYYDKNGTYLTDDYVGATFPIDFSDCTKEEIEKLKKASLIE